MGIPLDLQRTLQIKPMGVRDGVMLVAPLYPLTSQEILNLSQAESGMAVEQQPADRQEILQYLRSISGSTAAYDAKRDYSSDFSTHLLEAVEANASDLHIRLMRNSEPSYLRRRVHGYLQQPMFMDGAIVRRFMTWIKQKADLDSSEHLHPQEGRFSLFANGVTLEFRVSCSGQSEGETMVIRLLDPRRKLSYRALSANAQMIGCLEKLVTIESKQGGLVLISGPTGAGKTTTLAALTSALPLDRLKVVSIEDPVEIRTAGVDHLEVDAAHGLGFAALLRAVLRQDPDVIVIGEIRDAETAEIALRAVETGHWVMASVHAGSVLETVLRLTSLLPSCYQDLGRMTIQNRLHAVINQQLLPRSDGRQLVMEALFVQTHEHPMPWYSPQANLAEFSGCTYFARQ
jgi:type II secretory ATPase GspE/PulE/Tfp pilus assembly ATPase PilB-like protein